MRPISYRDITCSIIKHDPQFQPLMFVNTVNAFFLYQLRTISLAKQVVMYYDRSVIRFRVITGIYYVPGIHFERFRACILPSMVAMIEFQAC